MKTNHHFNALALAVAATTFAPLTAVAYDGDLIDSKIVDTQYAGGQNVFVRWSTYNWDDSTYYNRRSHLVVNRYGAHVPRRYSLFARELGGEYFLVKDLGASSDRTWSGRIKGLNENNPLQLQVREQHVDTGEYSEGLQAPGKVIDITDTDHPPSFDHQGDQLNLTFTPSEPNNHINYIDYIDYMQFTVDDWATNFSDGEGGTPGFFLSDGDDSTQVFFIERVYGLDSGISGRLSFDSIGQLSGEYNKALTPSDGFVVFQACDASRYIPHMGWMGACGEEAPVILRSERLPAHDNLPSFTMGNSVSVGNDYSMQEIPNWTTNITAGNNATPGSALVFQTIWVTNSDLFEVGPWVSTPSGTLRFKFKEGVSGTSKMYVTLADWDESSPDNDDGDWHTYTDVPIDHSSIHTIEFTVGSNTQERTMSNGSRGSDMPGIPSPDQEIRASNGGGGAAGLALFSLGLLAFSRRK